MLLCIEKENDDDELDNHEDTIKLERRGGGEKKWHKFKDLIVK